MRSLEKSINRFVSIGSFVLLRRASAALERRLVVEPTAAWLSFNGNSSQQSRRTQNGIRKIIKMVPRLLSPPKEREKKTIIKSTQRFFCWSEKGEGFRTGNHTTGTCQPNGRQTNCQPLADNAHKKISKSKERERIKGLKRNNNKNTTNIIKSNTRIWRTLRCAPNHTPHEWKPLIGSTER
jgi:hypothetical protein